jgi:RNA polymerase sigma factor (sigma-70 family)
MIDDAELLRRYAEERSEPAFAELVRRHVNVVYAAALRRVGGDAHLAEEVAQVVFTILARKAGSLARHPVLVGWLHRSTHYAALDALRDKLRREKREHTVESETMNGNAETNPSRRTDLDWDELGPIVDSLLDRLPERDRGALLLRFFEDQSFSEIGATLRLTEDAARMRVERALEKLRVALMRRGITSTAAALGLALANQAAATAPAGVAASVTAAALKGAGTAAGGAVVSLIQILNMGKIQTGVIVAVAVASVAIFIVETRATRTLATEIAGVRANRTDLHSLQDENDRLKQAVATPSPANEDATELARLRQRAAEMRAQFVGQRFPSGGRVMTQQEADARYRTSPLMAVQGIVGVAPLNRFERVALLLCFDAPGRARLDAFIAALLPDARAKVRSPELLLAPVFSQWMWKGDPPKGYGDPFKLIPVGVDADMELRVTHASGRVVQAERYSFKRFDDGWSFRPLTAAEVEEMIALLNPATGEPRSPPPMPVLSPPR